MGKVILNVDLGEGETSDQSVAFIQCVGAANIACGGHAGNDESMKQCLDACIANGTFAGAHPGTSGNFGRDHALPTADEFSQLLETQWQRITHIADLLGVSLHHIKLHGQLYMAVEHSETLANAYLCFLRQLTPTPVIFSLAEGKFHKLAEAAGLPVWGELFADRQYEADATLRARQNPDALIHHTEDIERRVSQWLDHGKILAMDNSPITLKAETICLHSDTPNALATARRLQQLLS
ncbi:MAG: LamB/YcsF family protein [Verrucomicrobiota bacterium]